MKIMGRNVNDIMDFFYGVSKVSYKAFKKKLRKKDGKCSFENRGGGTAACL